MSLYIVLFSYWVWTEKGSQCSRSSWRRSWGRPVCPGRTVLQTSLSRIFPGRWIRQNLHRGKNTKRDEGENLSESLCVYSSQNHFWKRLSLHERKTVCLDALVLNDWVSSFMDLATLMKNLLTHSFSNNLWWKYLCICGDNRPILALSMQAFTSYSHRKSESGSGWS